MVIIRAKGSTQQPPRKIILRAVAYDTVLKRTVLSLYEMKIGTRMILKKKKLNLEMRTPTPGDTLIQLWGSTSTAVEVKKIRKVTAIRREIEEANKITAKKTATRKVHLQIKRSETFDMCIKSMKSLSSSTINEYIFIQLIQQ